MRAGPTGYMMGKGPEWNPAGNCVAMYVYFTNVLMGHWKQFPELKGMKHSLPTVFVVLSPVVRSNN